MSYCGQFQAGEFLVSSQSNTSAQETELDENVHSHDEYADSASLMEQVLFCCCLQIVNMHDEL